MRGPMRILNTPFYRLLSLLVACALGFTFSGNSEAGTQTATIKITRAEMNPQTSQFKLTIKQAASCQKKSFSVQLSCLARPTLVIVSRSRDEKHCARESSERHNFDLKPLRSRIAACQRKTHQKIAARLEQGSIVLVTRAHDESAGEDPQLTRSAEQSPASLSEASTDSLPRLGAAPTVTRETAAEPGTISNMGMGNTYEHGEDSRYMDDSSASSGR